MPSGYPHSRLFRWSFFDHVVWCPVMARATRQWRGRLPLPLSGAVTRGDDISGRSRRRALPIRKICRSPAVRDIDGALDYASHHSGRLRRITTPISVARSARRGSPSGASTANRNPDGDLSRPDGHAVRLRKRGGPKPSISPNPGAPASRPWMDAVDPKLIAQVLSLRSRR